MAKPNLPSVDGIAGYQRHAAIQPKHEEPKSVAEGYASRRVDCKLTSKQAIKFRDIQRQLQDSGETLADGSFISNRAKAVQWLVENYQ